MSTKTRAMIEEGQSAAGGWMTVQFYIFTVELVEEDDGRWSALGCATWGETREAALHNIRNAAEAYLRSLRKNARGVSRCCIATLTGVAQSFITIGRMRPFPLM
jgi:predicted RNase H-like HicB family nuclease